MNPSADKRPTCRVVCAAAGYGKTTALRAWYPAGARWHRGLPGGAGDPVGALAGAVFEEARAGAGQIVFDDLPRLPVDTARLLTEALGRDLAVDVALASRWPLGAAATALPDRAHAVVGPAELSLPVDRVADLLADDYDVTDWTAGGYDAGARDLPERVHQATAGWPALVHLAAEMLRTGGVPHGDLLPVLAAPGGLIASYLAEEVLPALPEPALRLIEHVGDLAPIDPGLCRALGHPGAAETVRLLARCGLLTTAGSPPPVPGGPPPTPRIVPVVAGAVLRSRRTGGPAGVVARAAAWFDEHGPPASAALAHRRCGQDESCARVIEEHGEAMLAAGHAETVGLLIAELPAALRTPRLWLLLGDARRAGGDLDAALRAYEAAAPGLPAGSAALAWRRGRLHYHRGDARATLAALAEAGPGPHPPADAAQVSAWTATGHLLAGDPETALRHAREAVALARAGTPGLDPAGADFALTAALAAAQVSVALCLGALGDDAGSDEHYRLAQPVAERIGDVVLLTRIMNNRTFHLLQAARFTEALAAARTCARYAAAARQPELRDIATCNEADALAMLGRFDEAVRQYDRAIAGYRRAGSRRVAGAQLGLGEVYRRRGWREQARAAYEAAVRISTETGDGHVRGPAEAGLALVLMADDPGTATAHAAAAGSGGTPALLARGWLALHRGDRPPAGELATRACENARAQGDRLGLADALELRGAVYAAEPGRARTALRECQAIWAEAGAAVEAARIAVAISRLPGAGPDDRIRGLLAAQRMESAGAVAAGSPLAGRPVDPAADGPAAEVGVQALGRFEVRVGGEPVPPSRWQSRKARDLLRILVARRGRPVPREELCELLWPGDDPARTGHRLSVLLSIVRGVLDPAKARAADHYLVADQASIALDVTRVRVDVEDFLSYVARAARLLDAGDAAEARELLVTIDRQHTADAFDDEPYANWSGPLREQTRTAYLSMLRMLARVCGPGTSADAGAGYLLRLLERDPYDEPAHRSLVRRLVRAGRHGEARRAFHRYGEAMREIGVRPPDRSLLAPPALNGKSR